MLYEFKEIVGINPPICIYYGLYTGFAVFPVQVSSA
jgi:hypothetical protein